jgi:hypothetical protein
MLPDAIDWLQVLRHTLIDLLAPRSIEEILPTGIPPPGGCARWRGQGSLRAVGQLLLGLELSKDGARMSNIPSRALWTEAHGRWHAHLHSSGL